MTTDDALDAVAEKYATGEITESKFREIVTALGGDPDDMLGLDDEDDNSNKEYTTVELREMDDATAATELTNEQQERREKLLSLQEEAENTQDRWEDERETVGNVIVQSDLEALGSRLNLYGNLVLVQLNTDNDQLREGAEKLQSFADEETELENVDWDKREDLAVAAKDVLDALLIEWDGTRWDRLPQERRSQILNEAREAWGYEHFFAAVMNALLAARAQFNDLEEQAKSFRGS